MKRLFLFTGIILCLWQPLASQSLSKSGVLSVQLRNSGVIQQDDQVKGYYYFYNVEKEDRKNNNYLLSIVDENLREISSINITRPRNYILTDGVFNGTAFGFMFYDGRERKVELISYDRTLKQTGTSTKEITNKYSQAYFNQIAQGNPASQPFLIGVPNQGFLFYGTDEASKKYEFDISFYDNTMKKRWSTVASNEKFDMETAGGAFQNEQFAGSMIAMKKGAMSKDMDFELLMQNISDGKTLFRVPLGTAKYNVMLSEIFFDEQKQNFVVFGEYHNKEDKELKSQSLGFMSLVLDMKGKILSEKINSWADHISKATPVNERGKFDGSNTNILFHDLIRTSDGQIFAIGEQYKKATNAGGLAAQVLLGAAVSAAQLNVYNLVIFQFDPDFSIKKVHIFEKDKNVTELPMGAAYMSSKMLSYIAKAFGGFDYTFTQMSKDKSTFTIAYINYDREKGEKSKNLLGTIVYTPEKTFAVDKMALNRKSSDYFVHRAKEGYILVTEYFKKEKRLDSRLEKINY